MSINCFIASKNALVIDKIQNFIHKHCSLCVFDEEELVFEDGYPMLIFFDLDSFKIGVESIKKILTLPFIPVFISSTYTKDFIVDWLNLDSKKIGFLLKTSTYSQFIEEISNVIDNN